MTPNPQPIASVTSGGWTRVCAVDDIWPDMGVCALVDGQQVAVFRLADNRLFAIANHDPHSGANVLSRGIVGDLGGEIVVASPIYKHHYSLRTGRCLEDDTTVLATFPVRACEGQVWLCAEQGALA